ncbi:MAG: IS1182 family transposase [Candidatus Desulforudis sp.]|nr:IS1182 family transposase [Desulforudis sp.]
MKKFKDYQPNQILLFPPSPHDWLPEDHPAHFINEVVELLDLSAIYDSYGELRGQPPYNPVMMVKVWIYGMSKDIRSSRKLERALFEDIGLRYLSGNQQPDYWTLSEFRRRHNAALGDLLVQTVGLAAKAGLVKLNHVALDGTKIKAHASKHRAMSYGRMEKEELRLRQEIDRLLKQVEANDRAEDQEYGNRRGYELPPELATREKRLEAIKKAKAELEAEARAKQEQEEAERQAQSEKNGKPKRKSKHKDPKPKDKDQRNFTDPESRIMRNSDKAFIQAYNAQATVDAETQIIVAADLTNQAADPTHLPEQVEQVYHNTGRYPKELSADAAYYSAKNLELLSEKGIEAFIPPDKVKHNEWRDQQAIRGPIPKNATTMYRMRRKLRTKNGRERYKLRQVSVEPVFGYVKEQLGLRQLLLRGVAKARSWWRFTCAVHNLLKIFRFGIRFKSSPNGLWASYPPSKA